MLVHAEGAGAADRRSRLVPDRYLRASDFDGKLGQANNPEWKTVGLRRRPASVVVPEGRDRLPLGPEGRRTPASGTWRPRKRATAAT